MREREGGRGEKDETENWNVRDNEMDFSIDSAIESEFLPPPPPSPFLAKSGNLKFFAWLKRRE